MLKCASLVNLSITTGTFQLHTKRDGINSHTLPVFSGVPQGSVLEPFLFVLYINDVLSTVSAESDIKVFADDILALYRIIQTASDYRHLQYDIDSIAA